MHDKYVHLDVRDLILQIGSLRRVVGVALFRSELKGSVVKNVVEEQFLLFQRA
jgi:hypothetical protein